MWLLHYLLLGKTGLEGSLSPYGHSQFYRLTALAKLFFSSCVCLSLCQVQQALCVMLTPPLNPPPIFMYVLSATRTMHIMSVLVPHLTCLLQRSPNCSPPHHCGRGNHHQEVGRPPSPLPPGLRLLQVKDRGSREQTAQHAFRDPPVPAHPG